MTAQPAKPAPTVTAKPRSFDHEGRNVYFLTPNDLNDTRLITEFIETSDLFSTTEKIPSVRSEIKPLRMRADSVVYVIHPVFVRQKNSAGQFRDELVIHVSEPFDLTKSGTSANDDGFVTVDPEALAGALSKLCRNDRGCKRFFRAQVSSVDKKFPSDALIKLTNQ